MLAEDRLNPGPGSLATLAGDTVPHQEETEPTWSLERVTCPARDDAPDVAPFTTSPTEGPVERQSTLIDGPGRWQAAQPDDAGDEGNKDTADSRYAVFTTCPGTGCPHDEILEGQGHSPEESNRHQGRQHKASDGAHPVDIQPDDDRQRFGSGVRIVFHGYHRGRNRTKGGFMVGDRCGAGSTRSRRKQAAPRHPPLRDSLRRSD